MAYPTLNNNEVISALYNQIIGIQTEAKNIAGVYGKLLDSMRIEGGMYGDTKVYIDTDCLASKVWGADASHAKGGAMDGEAANLLELNRPVDPETQTIVLDNFRQVFVTVDNYMTKRAFADEGSFASFNGVIRGWVADTKKIYDATTFNAYVGTAKSEVQNDVPVDVPAFPSAGQGIATELANLFVKMADVSRDYNDYKFLRSFDMNDIIVVWNSKYVNEVKKIDLPALFHKDGLIEKFEDYVLPERYFGTVNDDQKTADGTATRSLIEQVLDSGESGATKHHYFAGDLIKAGDIAPAGTSYQETDDIICKVMGKGSVPFMSSFSVGTSFFNPRSLTENQYLTWSHNTLEYLKGKPFVTVKAS